MSKLVDDADGLIVLCRYPCYSSTSATIATAVLSLYILLLIATPAALGNTPPLGGSSNRRRRLFCRLAAPAPAAAATADIP